MSEGQKNAVTALIEEHYEFLYRFAYRLSGSSADAEDLTQQTFLQAQRKLDQMRDPAKSRGWLVSILRNYFRKSFRKELPTNFSSFEDEIDPVAPVEAESSIDQEELQAALQEMPTEYRAAVTLFFLEDLSYKQIAEILEIPMGTVMSRLSRGKSYLRRRLAGQILSIPSERSGIVPHNDGVE